jgi:hypothetical protein
LATESSSDPLSDESIFDFISVGVTTATGATGAGAAAAGAAGAAAAIGASFASCSVEPFGRSVETASEAGGVSIFLAKS